MFLLLSGAQFYCEPHLNTVLNWLTSHLLWFYQWYNHIITTELSFNVFSHRILVELCIPFTTEYSLLLSHLITQLLFTHILLYQWNHLLLKKRIETSTKYCVLCLEFKYLVYICVCFIYSPFFSVFFLLCLWKYFCIE